MIVIVEMLTVSAKLTSRDVDLYWFLRRGMLVSERGIFPMTFRLIDDRDQVFIHITVTFQEYKRVYSQLWNPWKQDKSKGRTL